MNKDYIRDLIIMNVTGFSKNQLFLNSKISVCDEQSIKDKLKRFEEGEPIEYIINNSEFYSLDFYVDNRVLIPRNDTEILVKKAIDEINKDSSITLIDVGTGSSCIAISILKNIKEYRVNRSYVIDISENALEVSKINIEKHFLNDKIIQIKSDLLASMLTNYYQMDKKLIITANLPYVKDRDYKNMDSSTILYEPEIALYGGEETGFLLYEKLINECIYLKNKGFEIIIFIEIGFDQFEYSSSYLTKLGLSFDYFKDNSNIYRCVKIKIGKI